MPFNTHNNPPRPLLANPHAHPALALEQLAPCQPPTLLAFNHWARALVLVPHPDDEVLGCGGLLAQLHDSGIATHVILVTNGDGAGGLPTGASKTRQAEFIQALQLLGPALSHECWQLPDGGLQAVSDLPDRLNNAVAEWQASVLIAPWPGDMHPDHAVLGRVAAALQRRSPLTQGVLFYEVWSPLPARHLLDVTAYWPRKVAALQCHQTALACGDYQRAMAGLAQYRSLLTGNVGRAPTVTEAYYGIDVEKNSQEVRYRFALNEDAHAIQALFEATFDTQTPPQWWAWKYQQEPHPGSVAFSAQGELIAFYGAQARHALWQQQRVAVCQQGDVMVAPHYRFATRTQGVFKQLSEHFLNRLVGENRPFALSFGFPTPKAMQLGELLGLYRRADDLQQGYTAAQPTRLGLGVSISLQPAPQVEDWHWLTRLTHLPATNGPVLSLAKTPEHWARRFGGHPEPLYHVLQVKRFGKLRAAAVVKPLDNGALELMDLALATPGAAALLWRAWHHAASLFNCYQLTAWGTECMLNSLPLTERSGAGSLALPGHAIDAPLTEAVAGHCWLLGGDTDFR